MIKVEYGMKVGKDELKIQIEAEDHAKLIQQLSFFTNIPKTGPNGEEDLRLVHRVAADKYHYYSVICDSAQMEYKFGQSQKEPGKLFCKGPWEPLFSSDAQDQQDSTQQTQAPAASTQTVAKTAAPVAKTTVAKSPATTVVKTTAPAATQNPAPSTTPKVAVGLGIGKVNTVAKTTTPAVTPAQTTVAKTVTPGATPPVAKSNAAAQILAKMNIKTNNTQT